MSGRIFDFEDVPSPPGRGQGEGAEGLGEPAPNDSQREGSMPERDAAADEYFAAQTEWQRAPEPQAVTSPLVDCPDCNHKVSRHAEACPQCGRFFQPFGHRVLTVIPGGGWVSRVAWGVVVSSFLWAAILVAFFIIGIFLLMVLAGVGTALPPPR